MMNKQSTLSTLFSTLFSTVIALICFGVAAPAQADPPSWAPAHGHRAKHNETRTYRYVYYPEQRVYYAPATRNWFWLSGNNWQVGAELPGRISINVGGNDSIPVVLHSRRPYVEHVYVEERYGRPWRNTYRRDHDRHHRHHRHHHDHRH